MLNLTSYTLSLQPEVNASGVGEISRLGEIFKVQSFGSRPLGGVKKSTEMPLVSVNLVALGFGEKRLRCTAPERGLGSDAMGLQFTQNPSKSS